MTSHGNLRLEIQPLRGVLTNLKENRRWIFGSIIFILLFVASSAILFHYFEQNQNIDWINSVYFTIINVTTVGFGDIVPKSSAGEWLAMANSLVGVLVFGFIISVVSVALQPSGFTAQGRLEPATADTPQTREEGTVMFLNGLGALLGNSGKDTHTRILIRGILAENQEGYIIIEVDIRRR